MKKSRSSDSQILRILKQAENGCKVPDLCRENGCKVPDLCRENGCKVPDLCREYGMSSAAFYKWRAKYGGMDVSMMPRMKELEKKTVN